MPTLMREMLANLAAAAQSTSVAADSPWLAAARRSERILLVLYHQRQGPRRRVQLQPDQGARSSFFEDHPGAEVTLDTGGPQRPRFLPAARRRDPRPSTSTCAARPAYEDAAAIAREAIRRYRDGETDAVYLLNNEFNSVMSQKLSVCSCCRARNARSEARSEGLHLRAIAGRDAGAPDAALCGSGGFPRAAGNHRRRIRRRA